MEKDQSLVGGLSEQNDISKEKNVQVETVDNGFVVNLQYRTQVKIAKDIKEVLGFIEEYLTSK